ncbi:MAG TPA: hypothetical protein ENK78_00010 [Thiothrix sp.]|nr:hypothetical protein [Thiothrix sp.]
MIIKRRLAQLISGVLITGSLSTHAADVEINLNSATDALTVDQPTGTELMRVSGNGNVGIGTDSPSGKLDVQDTNGRLGLFSGSTFISRNSGNTLIVRNSDTTGGNLGQIILERGDGSGDDMAITTTYDNSNGVNSLGIASGNNMLMSILKNGKLGIATETPTSMLEIVGNGSSSDGLLKASDAADNDEIILDPNFGVTQNRTNAYFNNALVGGTISLRVSDTAARDTVALTAASNGNVGIGTSTPTRKLEVNGGSILTKNGTITVDRHFAGPSIIMTNSDKTYYPNVADQWEIYPHGNSSNPSATDSFFSITSRNLSTNSPTDHVKINSATSNMTLAGTLTQNSDERLKKDIKPIEGALDKVKQLQGVTYQWKDEKKGTETQLGLIAQQVEKIVPEVVKTAQDKQGTKSVAYANLVALLIESTKELQQENESLKARLDALEQSQK